MTFAEKIDYKDLVRECKKYIPLIVTDKNVLKFYNFAKEKYLKDIETYCKLYASFRTFYENKFYEIPLIDKNNFILNNYMIFTKEELQNGLITLQEKVEMNLVDQNKEIKIIILGGGTPGKSSLAKRFIEGKYISGIEPNFEEIYCKIISGIKLVINVSPSQEEYKVFVEDEIRKQDVCIVCYNVLDKRTFNEAKEYLELIKRVTNNEQENILLVALRCDEIKDLWQVKTEDGLQLAIEYKIQFFETSSLLDINVNEIFYNSLMLYYEPFLVVDNSKLKSEGSSSKKKN
ncbi:hypothetical protein ABK040_011475 [Willaertia magna]